MTRHKLDKLEWLAVDRVDGKSVAAGRSWFVGDDGAGPGNLSFVGCRLGELAR